MEISNMLDGNSMILSLNDIGCNEELPEDRLTLEENASQKSWYLYDNYGYSCFADDTGLEIDALDGEPGVFSARYAGPERNPEANMDKVLMKLSKINNRNARFRTVISLVLNGKETRFEGVVNGTILFERKGQGGFGYDPIFKPDESVLSFAEMALDEKNKISHRGRAFIQLVEFLKQQNL